MAAWRLMSIAMAASLAGCTPVGPDYAPPEISTPTAYATPAPAGVADVRAWHRGFNDPNLDRLIAQALVDNLSIAQADARLAEARALVREASAEGGPTLDGRTDGEIEGRAIDGGRNSDDEVAGAGSASLLFAWTPDLFGRFRRGEEAAEAEARRQALLRDDLARLTVADVARQFLEARRAAAQLDLLSDSLKVQEHTLDLARNRFEAGIAARLDVSRAEADLADTLAGRGPFMEDRAEARSALAVLAGAYVQNVDLGPAGMVPQYAGGPPVGLPNDLLRNRPDVRAAEANLARRTAEIGIEEAAFYPELTIPGDLTASLTGIGTGDVVKALIASLGAALDIPIFDSGGRRARVDAADARAEEALLLYRSVLVDAAAEAELALARVVATDLRLKDVTEAVRANQTAFEEAEALYAQGIVGFLDVLDAWRGLLDNQRRLIDAQTDASRAIVDLYEAVGAPVTDGGVS